MVDSRWQFWIDVGGTFTDCIARPPQGQLLQHKTLSSAVVMGTVGPGSDRHLVVDSRRRADPEQVWRGYHIKLHADAHPVQQREVVSFHRQTGRLELDRPLARPAEPGTVYELDAGQPAPLVAIRYLLGLDRDQPIPPVRVRLGTTRGTNALITRRGASVALVTTRGFQDMLRIGYQARADLFALNIIKPRSLFTKVVEIDERLDADGNVLRPCDPRAARRILQSLREQDVKSLAISLLHACANPIHERLLADLAREVGFDEVSVSHEVSTLRKLVARGDTTVVDAYLNPVLRDYLHRIKDALHPDSDLEVMTSSGGLAEASFFRGKDSILSGPAGGVVGVAHVARQAGFGAAIGFDMGGTSTDVSRWAGEFELEYESEKAGVRVVTPMMAIETVAAGGGSICHFDGVKLNVGPDSAGADPGPACYGRGGPLAVTDVNYYLGKILPEAFPFDLDRTAVERLLHEQCEVIWRATAHRYTPTELADGYLRVANTNMVEAIRCVTVAQGYDPRGGALVAFGGAAPQHACAVADQLGVKQILIHPSAGILSALGIGLAEVTVHREAGIYATYDDATTARIQDLFRELTEQAAADLRRSGRDDARLDVRESLDMRFHGLDAALTVPCPADGDFRRAYLQAYQNRYGYVPDHRDIEIVTARVAVTAVENRDIPLSSRAAPRVPTAARTTSVCFAGERLETSLYARDRLRPGDVFSGPAIVTEAVSTTIVDPGWSADVLSGRELLLTRQSDGQTTGLGVDLAAGADPVLLEVFNKRFAAIATRMGATLRKNAISVNVKERLDFSCAIFTADGHLVVNAPHIPVHLGAMGETVRHVLQNMQLEPGDVVVTNDPYHGGSHLPDVTVVTPVHDVGTGRLRFLTASRAHHAEIGGVTPGSMPPFSRNLAEEGVLIRAMKLIAAGKSRVDSFHDLLCQGPHPSRNPALNVADVTAQVAANRQGAGQLLSFVDEVSWPVVEAYMRFIQDAAERKMRQALARLPDGERVFTDHLDDGSPITLRLTIAGETAELDFAGTGPVLPNNLNANRAIVVAAVMYCLRCLIDEDIPLNHGVLQPIDIHLPTCLLNPTAQADPRECPAVVGGNVETSQRIVDVILGAFGIAAASQGTMNNLLFGDDSFGYYETICGGAGAAADAAGADAVHTHMTNTRLTDPEVLESRFPVRVREFSIRDGSGGRGARRGGHGVIREIEFLKAMTVSLVTQRRGPYAPYGVHGGGHGACGENWLIRRDGTREKLDASSALNVQPGDAIHIKTPGGGGWGRPA